MRTPEEISEIMKKVKSAGTEPEEKLRKALFVAGVQLSEQEIRLPGKPDILIPAHHIAIFVDGDFWHGNQWRLRGLNSLEEQFSSSDSKEYWVNKIRKNVIRDSKVTYELFESGWVVIRLWESDIEDNIGACVQVVLNHIQESINYSKINLLTEKSFAEFFAGIGLMRMGLEKRGWKIQFANDMDPEKIKMYKGQFQDNSESLSMDDIHLLPVEKVPTVTLATASFPCNDLSLAGSRHGLNEGKQSSAFWGFVRILDEMGVRKPPFVLLENVFGFLTSKGGEDFHQALLTLNELGYQVDSFILDAANFVPQSRKRLFVLGTHQSVRKLASSNLILDTSNARPEALKTFIFNHPDIDWAIRRLPSQPKLLKTLTDILDDLPDDAPEWWNKERVEYFLNQMNVSHRKTAEQMIKGNDWSYATAFRRVRSGKSMAELRTDGIAGCLRTPRGGSGRQILFKAGLGRFYVRLLTPRECARLMGADQFNITVPFNQALFGFGDAVCVPVISWIAENYLNPLINELIHETAILDINQGEDHDHRKTDNGSI